MASGLLMLLDDIATLMDDVAAMTKVAARKTAGVLGDDLALNAEQVSGVRAERELPIVYAVAKGSLKNKCILVPAALLISAVAAWLITPLLMLGGLYLCYEGVEKLVHAFQHKTDAEQREQHRRVELIAEPNEEELLAFEAEKIKGAIRTDFILSAEIIVITLGTVASAPFLTQSLVVTGIALLMTVGVYGLVAGIVKLDDMGLYLVNRNAGRFSVGLGKLLLAVAPMIMKILTVVGTAAMFMVGGGILVHGIHSVAELFEHWSGAVAATGGAGEALSFVLPTLLSMAFGIVAGALALAVASLVQKVRG